MSTHAVPHHAIAARGRHRRWTVASLGSFAIEHFLLLPIGGLIALVWANTGPESYFTFAHRLSFAVNQVGMALFFALITQEVVEAVMSGGALHTWRRWSLALVAAAGGMLGSALVYLVYVHVKHEPVLADGWLVACAFDVAFAYFIVRIIFGRQGAVPFLLLMAIATNAFVLLLVASRYDVIEIYPGGTVLMIAAIGLAAILRHQRVRSFWPYLLACGSLSWWALFLDGIHPALALVPIVPFMTHAARRLDLFVDAPHGAHDSPSHFEHVWKYPVQAVLFVFGLVNAGVLLTRYGTGTWALLTAALAGRPLGMLAAVALAVALGLHLPTRLHWRDLVVVALAASSGFTFTLFAATGVYPVGPLLSELKLGAILTGVGVPLAFLAAWLLGAGRFAHRAASHHHHAHAATVVVFLLAVLAGAGAAAPSHGLAGASPPHATAPRLLVGHWIHRHSSLA